MLSMRWVVSTFALSAWLKVLSLYLFSAHTPTLTHTYHWRSICLDGVQSSMKMHQHGVALKGGQNDWGRGWFGGIRIFGRGYTNTATTTLASGSISELIVCFTQILLSFGQCKFDGI